MDLSYSIKLDQYQNADGLIQQEDIKNVMESYQVLNDRKIRKAYNYIYKKSRQKGQRLIVPSKNENLEVEIDKITKSIDQNFNNYLRDKPNSTFSTIKFFLRASTINFFLAIFDIIFAFADDGDSFFYITTLNCNQTLGDFLV